MLYLVSEYSENAWHWKVMKNTRIQTENVCRRQPIVMIFFGKGKNIENMGTFLELFR